MKRDRCRIRPLLAGHLRPHRTPPRETRAMTTGPALRISFTAGSDLPSNFRFATESISTAFVQANSALMTADQALNTAYSLLQKIDNVWKHIEAQLIDEGAASDSAAPQLSAPVDWQCEIDGLIASIDRACSEARCNGEHLFNGTWSIVIDEDNGAATKSLTLPRIHTSMLGNLRIGGFLTALASEGDYDVKSGCVADARAILRASMFQLAGMREEIAEFMATAVDPAQSSTDVATENAAAATSVLMDTNFIRQAGGVTQIDALIAGKAAISQQNFLQIFS